MLNGWLTLALSLMLINWLAVWRQIRKLDVLTKPLVIVMLSIWLAFTVGPNGNLFCFFLGLLISSLGDILLLFKGYFLAGLAAFFLVHSLYLLGFNLPLPSGNIPIYALLILFTCLWAFFCDWFRKGIAHHPAGKRLVVPVGAYSLLLCLMACSACATLFRSDWQPAAASLVTSGALLFLYSDFLLAVDRFMQPLPTARLWKRVAYQLGQLAIAAGAALNFSKGIRSP